MERDKGHQAGQNKGERKKGEGEQRAQRERTAVEERRKEKRGEKEPHLPFTPSRRTTHPTPAHTTLAGLQTGIPPPATMA